jgi:hypothetical protein
LIQGFSCAIVNLMTPRENIEEAFSPGGAREFGAVICYEGIMIRDHWDELTAAPWWDLYSPDPARQIAWRRDVLRTTGQDWFALEASEPAAARPHLSVEPAAEGAIRVDSRTGARSPLRRPAVSGWRPDGAVQSNHSRSCPATTDEIDALFPAPPPFDAAAFLKEGRSDMARSLIAAEPARLPWGYTLSPLWRVQGPLGFESFMTLIAERPELVERAAERALAISLDNVRVRAALGARAIWIEECMTDMIHPDAFARLNVPFMRRLCDRIRELGMISVYYYCGGMEDRLEAILDCGADAVGLEETKKGFRIDIGDVAEAVDGRCALLGNLDAMGLLEHGSEQDLRAELRRQARAGRRNGSRFIFSLGSPVTPGTSMARVRLYTDLAHEEGLH